MERRLNKVFTKALAYAVGAFLFCPESRVFAGKSFFRFGETFIKIVLTSRIRDAIISYTRKRDE